MHEYRIPKKLRTKKINNLLSDYWNDILRFEGDAWQHANAIAVKLDELAYLDDRFMVLSPFSSVKKKDVARMKRIAMRKIIRDLDEMIEEIDDLVWCDLGCSCCG
tara:strand:+ start:427 stop:741 length:315 start_codon:yes stop_codon:yes gene_type:complete